MTETAARPEIAMSWRRSELAGLNPGSEARPSYTEVDVSSRLMVAAAPVLDDLAELLDGNAFSLVLVDRDCRLSYLWGGSHRFLDIIGSIGVMVGVGLDEWAYGTTALGAGVEIRSPLEIHGQEHFLESLKAFSCYGTPIRHPLTRRLEGVLDITSVAPQSNPLFRPLIERAARDIRARIVDGARESERRLFLAFQHATRLRSAPIAVLGGDVVLANRACLDLLGIADPAVLRTLLPEVSRHGIAARELDLGPGGRISVTAERVDGTPDGAIFQLAERGRPVFSDTAPPTRLIGRSVLVAGEPGSGRTTAAREAAGDAPVVTLDATAAVAGSERGWAAQVVGLASRHTGVIVVDDVDVLPERLCAVLRRTMDFSGRVRFVFTSSPVDELPPHVARLVARCTRRIDVPPLRERLHELPALIAKMGAAVRPDRHWTLTPRALAALAAQPWTGNLTELAALVNDLARQPAIGRLDLLDLPARYRAGSRAVRIGGLERAERAAIMQALAAAGGNKLRAAEHLGISRTTLYRRMRALHVPVE